jgi:hypothetical protein
MTAMAIQIVTKPLPGADMKRILGNLVFNARWDNFTSYGKAMDHMVGDQAVQAIAAKNHCFRDCRMGSKQYGPRAYGLNNLG